MPSAAFRPVNPASNALHELAVQGGGLFNGGIAILGECLIMNNTVTGGYIYGGGVYNAGILTVTSSTIAGNGMESDGQGGGIYTSGNAIMQDCSVLGNQGALGGGGIWNEGSLAVTNCTIAANVVYYGGFGPAWGGGLLTRGGDAVLVNTTVSENRLSISIYDSDYDLRGIGIYNDNGGTLTLLSSTVCRNGNNALGVYDAETGLGVYNDDYSGGIVNVQNSIISGNGDPYADGPDFYGTITSEGYNLIGNANGCTITGDTTGNLLGLDPVLGPLDDYGGPTMTVPLLSGSPAIDAGDTADTPPFDQRGHSRPYGPASDIGAFESSPPYTIRGTVYGYTFKDEVAVDVETNHLTTTNGGYYRLDGLDPGTYFVSPQSSNYLFVPDSRTLALGPDQVGVQFHAYHWNMLSLDDFTNGILHLVFPGTNEQTCRLQESVDLNLWLTVSTNTFGTNNHLDYFLPTQDSTVMLFRAAEP